MTDSELKAAFEEHKDAVYRFAWRMMNSPAAAEDVAQDVFLSLLRLPGAVKQVFEERLREALPLAADKVLHRVRETRGGDKLYDARFHIRGRGEGVYAQTIAALFDTTVLRLGFNDRDAERDMPSRFRRPRGQLSLFE